jgi:insertion element IS1 protein InsB
MDHRNSRAIAWVTGDRDAATFKRLFEKLKHCIFYTDDWEAFAKVLPKNQDVVRKKETVTIQRDNRNSLSNGDLLNSQKYLKNYSFFHNCFLFQRQSLTFQYPIFIRCPCFGRHSLFT